jgi:putative hemolysin
LKAEDFLTKQQPLNTSVINSILQIKFSPVSLAILPQTVLTILVFVLLILLFISFIVSGAEVALFSLSFKDINLMKTKTFPSAKRILKLLEEPKLLLGSLLITNTLTNIGIIIICNFLFNEWFNVLDSFFLTLIIKIVSVSLILILFAEALPKVWAAHNNLRFAYYSSSFIHVIHYLFKGLSAWMVGFSDRVEKALGGSRTNAYSLEQLDQAIEMTTHQDATEEEKNILKGIVKFGNITVRQVMKSRLDVQGIDAGLTFAELLRKVEEQQYSRFPVYQANLDNVTGIIHTKDLVPHLNEADDYDWKNLVRPPYFVHENKLIEDLLQEFQSKRIHFAVVVDEFGGTEGIVTLEDIMEEIIGDIRDEFDEEDSVNPKMDDFNFVFDGRKMVSDACRVMGLPADTFDGVRGDSETMAGLVLELAGEIPQINQEIVSGDFTFAVQELVKNRIQKVKVTIRPSQQAN